MSRVAFYTLGCKLNFAETGTIRDSFLEKEYEVVPFGEPADVAVINTCTVTEEADRKCRQIIRRALRANENAFIIVTGCYAQLQPETIAKIEGVDAVLGANEKFQLFNVLHDFEKREQTQIDVSCIDDVISVACCDRIVARACADRVVARTGVDRIVSVPSIDDI